MDLLAARSPRHRQGLRQRQGLLGLGLAAAVTLGTVGAAPAFAQDGSPAPKAAVRPELPAPTGPHAVGTVSTRLVDHARPDPWVTSRPYRELMVSVWYPARTKAGHERAPYMAPGAAAKWDAASPHGIPKGTVDWKGMRSHARLGAPVDTRGGKLPVLLYSAGANDPRTWGTSLVEELASRGYVVVTVDHTYETPGVQFPDGRVTDDGPLRDALKEIDEHHTMSQLLKKTLGIRVADDKFVLNQLGSLPNGLSKAVDQRRIGMFGQSAGGIAAAETMYEDKRIKAGVNLDGTLEYNPEPNGTNTMPVALHGLKRPFMLMGREGSDRHTEPSWKSFWKHSEGWKRNLTLSGSKHQTYTDLAAILPQTGLPRDVVEGGIGTVDPKRAVKAQRAYVVSFFDRWLRDRDDHLLDGPSPRYPEARFAG
ncbi:alpha/beta hydrolase family protein [Streptomyces sp. NPDC059063]|uniref:alpha/beta hydrolase family protein n=1 Tax=unclassified Streptomyces TaxID=2593676 RepID=UPI0036AC647C